MKTIGSKLLSIILALVLTGALVPASALALEGEGVVASGEAATSVDTGTTPGASPEIESPAGGSSGEPADSDTAGKPGESDESPATGESGSAGSSDSAGNDESSDVAGGTDALLNSGALSALTSPDEQSIEPLSTSTVTYYDPLANQNKQVVATKMTTTKEWNGGWYYVDKDKAVRPKGDHIDVKGHVNLILTDGCLYEIDHSIVVPEGSSLTIWAQSGGTGTLDINGMSGAGIGSKGTTKYKNPDGLYIGYVNRHGAITINGGFITGVGGEGYPAIGGSSNEDITINHGRVVVTGGDGAAGIGACNTLTGPASRYSVNSPWVVVNGGEVTATGGSKTGGLTNYGYSGAGIGGGACENGNVIINGGSVNAKGRGGAAGIGTGSFGISDRQVSPTVTITGGTVVAQCVEDDNDHSGGAGIGGGSGHPGGTITITGGTVTATAHAFAAGIGGARAQNGGNITISGGKVTATGGSFGAGIGGGDAGDAKINITGGSVSAFAGSRGAGIGGGNGAGRSGIINISGTADVVAVGNEGGAGIGAGCYADNWSSGVAGNITISGGTVHASTVNSRVDYAGAAIGAGSRSIGTIDGRNGNYAGAITITGGDIVAEGNGYGAAVGTGYKGSGLTTIISGGTLTATTSGGAAAIGGGEYSLAGDIAITGGSIIVQAAGTESVALGNGKNWQSGTDALDELRHPSNLTINGDAAIIATSTDPQSRVSSQANKTVISGDVYMRNVGLRAGDGTSGTFTITGGNVDAITASNGVVPKNGSGAPVYKVRADGNPAFDNGAVVSATAGTGNSQYSYSAIVNTAFDRNAYLWLPQSDNTSVNSEDYATAHMPIKNNDSNAVTLQSESALSITGTAEYGLTLSMIVEEGGLKPQGCQWYRVGADGKEVAVGKPNEESYQLRSEDIGSYILCRATYSGGATQDSNKLLVQKRTVVPLGVSSPVEKTYDGTRFISKSVVVKVDTGTLPDDGKGAYIKAFARFNDANAGENKPAALFAHTLQGADTKLFRLPSVLPPKATSTAGTIAPCSLADADIVLDGSGRYPYTASPIEPAVLYVSISGNYVAPDQFTIAYTSDNRTDAGEKELVITAVAGGNYKDSATTSYVIEKIDPEVTSPYPSDKPLAAIFGQTLSELEPLPQGFEWECDPATTSAGTVGLNVFTAGYTPDDLTNYNVVTGIEIFVLVTADGASLEKVVALAEGIAGAAIYASPGLIKLKEAIQNGKNVLADDNRKPEDVTYAITWIAQALKDMGFSQRVSYGFKDDKSTFHYKDTAGLIHFTQKDVALHSGKVYVDETLLTQGDDYILDHPTASGITTITLTPDYLGSLDAGFHDLRVEFIDQRHSTNEFEVARIPVVITPEDKTVTYDPAGFDLEELGLFTIGENAGEARYSVIGGSGRAAVSGTHLTIDTSGTIRIMVATASDGTYAEGFAIATLTVEKADPPLPEVGTLQATIGKKLSYLTRFLPEGYAFEDDPYATFVGFIGLNIFTATYTPPDTLNYNVITGVEIFVEVTANDVILSELTEYAELLEERMIYETDALAYYREAIANAKNVLAHPEATQKDVDDAIAWIITALKDMGFYQDVDYAFKDNKSTYQIASKSTLIHITQKDLALHSGDFYVDERRLREGVDYHPESGSTQITLATEYLESLTPGTYSLRVEFIDGKHSLDTFTVIPADSKPVPPDNKPKTDDAIPATGDFGLPLLIALTAAAGLTLLLIARRNRLGRQNDARK